MPSWTNFTNAQHHHGNAAGGGGLDPSSLNLQGSVWPSFSVHKNGTNQTGIVTATWTKLTWSTEEFDTNSDFASDKFTPTVAGKYSLSAEVNIDDLADGATFIVALYKNGTEHRRLARSFLGAVGDAAIGNSSVVNANGSSDYFEIYVYHNHGSNRTILGASNLTWFTGCRIG